jgi:hypothetical protein
LPRGAGRNNIQYESYRVGEVDWRAKKTPHQACSQINPAFAKISSFFKKNKTLEEYVFYLENTYYPENENTT